MPDTTKGSTNKAGTASNKTSKVKPKLSAAKKPVKPAAAKPAAQKPASSDQAALCTVEKASAPRKAKARTSPKSKPAPKLSGSLKPAPAPRRTPSVSPNRDKTVAWYVEALGVAQRAIATELLALVSKAAPKSTASIKWSRPVWSHKGPFAWMASSRSHLTFGFWRGTELSGPGSELLVGTGDTMRHVKLLDGKPLPRTALTSLVKQAFALNDQKGDPTRR